MSQALKEEGKRGGEMGWGFGNGRKGTPVIRPPPAPTIGKRETLIQPEVMII